MKKLFTLILSLILITGAIITTPIVAYAAPSLKLEVRANPTTLATGGPVSFDITITNTGDTQIDDVYLSTGSFSEQFGVFSPGEIKNRGESLVMDVTEAMLDAPISFSVSGNSGGTPVSASQSVTIKKTSAAAKIAGKCDANRTSAPSGGKIAVTFTVENQGGVDLTNVTLSIPPVNDGKAIKAPFSLTTGAKRPIAYEFTLTEDVEITPTIKYTANGQEKTETLAKKKFVLANPSLELKLTADNTEPAAGDEVTYTVEVKNTGNAKLTDIKVYDYLQKQVTLKATSLNANASTSGTQKIKIVNSVSAVFTATAKDPDGLVSNYSSNELKVGSPIDPNQIQINLTVTPDITELTEPGSVKLEITAVNAGTYPLTNLVVLEPTLGEIGTSISFGPGEEKFFSKEVDISATETYSFSATANDMDGNSHSGSATPLTVTLQAEETPEPEPLESEEPLPSPTPEPVNSPSTLLIIIIVIVVLIIGVVIALIILVKKEKAGRGGGGHTGGGGSAPGGPTRPPQQNKPRPAQRPAPPQRPQQQRPPQRPQPPKPPPPKQSPPPQKGSSNGGAYRAKSSSNFKDGF